MRAQKEKKGAHYQIQSTVALRRCRSRSETGSIITYSILCYLDVAGTPIRLVEDENTQNDTSVNMHAWPNSRDVHRAAQPVNATLIFQRKHSQEEDMEKGCVCLTDFFQARM